MRKEGLMFQKVLKLFNDWGKYESAPMSAYIIKKSIRLYVKKTKVTLKLKINCQQFSHYISSTVDYFSYFLRYLLSLGRSKFEVAYLKKQIKSNI